MNVETQLTIVFILIVIAIIYIFSQYHNNKRESNCRDKCGRCDLHKHCNNKK